MAIGQGDDAGAAGVMDVMDGIFPEYRRDGRLYGYRDVGDAAQCGPVADQNKAGSGVLQP